MRTKEFIHLRPGVCAGVRVAFGAGTAEASPAAPQAALAADGPALHAPAGSWELGAAGLP